MFTAWIIHSPPIRILLLWLPQRIVSSAPLETTAPLYHTRPNIRLRILQALFSKLQQSSCRGKTPLCTRDLLRLRELNLVFMSWILSALTSAGPVMSACPGRVDWHPCGVDLVKLRLLASVWKSSYESDVTDVTTTCVLWYA